MSIIKVVAAVVDTRKLILYKSDGKTVEIPQGDPRLKSIVDAVLPIVKAGGVAEVDVDLMVENKYREFEQQSGGLIRFFRTAKKSVAHIFGAREGEEDENTVEPGVFGEIPSANLALTNAVDEIIKHAQPVSDEGFNPADDQPSDTMIAVVEDEESGELTVIPGVEALQDILDHSARNRNTRGVKALFKRLGKMIDKRGHSVEDLIRFLEKGDLPITDDGAILAYKRLYREKDPKTGETYFVDPHTRRVRQKVGSYVCLAENLVDKDRRNECSNGLHIGRRQYMGSFSGDVITLCRVEPEDVIVVPHNDPNKVRVCGYHILAELSEEGFRTICRNEPMTTVKGLAELLGRALAGKHIARLEKVEIGGARGGNLTITPLVASRSAAKVVTKGKTEKAVAIDDPTMKKDSKVPQEPSTVDPKALAGQVMGSRQQTARELWNIVNSDGTVRHGPAKRQQAAKDLLAFKKKSKVSWEVLGLSKSQVATVMNIAESGVPVEATPKQAKPKATPAPARPAAKKAKPAPAPTPTPAPDKLTKNERVRLWVIDLNMAEPGTIERALVARQMLDARRMWKKSWVALGQPGMTDDQLKQIINAAPANVPHVAEVAKLPKAKKASPEPISQHDRSKMRMGHKPTHDDGRLVGRPKNDPKEMNLPADKKEALRLVRSGQTVSQASKATGVHRRSIDRLIGLYGK